MPDFFHCIHDLVKGSALSLARQVRHARQALTQAEAVLSKHTGPEGRPQGDAEAQHHVEVKRAAVQRWEEVQSTYRHHLETLSLTLHPFHLHDAKSVHRRFIHSTVQIRRYDTLAWVTQCTNVMWLDLARQPPSRSTAGCTRKSPPWKR